MGDNSAPANLVRSKGELAQFSTGVIIILQKYLIFLQAVDNYQAGWAVPFG
jgi:hypothetical protein